MCRGEEDVVEANYVGMTRQLSVIDDFSFYVFIDLRGDGLGKIGC